MEELELELGFAPGSMHFLALFPGDLYKVIQTRECVCICHVDLQRRQGHNSCLHPPFPACHFCILSFLPASLTLSSFFILFLLFRFIFDRERDRAQVGEGQRERETQNPKRAPGSELSAQSPTRVSNSRTERS